MTLDALGACVSNCEEDSNRKKRVVAAHEAILVNAFSLKAKAKDNKVTKNYMTLISNELPTCLMLAASLF